MINLTTVGSEVLPNISTNIVDCVTCEIQIQMLQAQFSFLNTVKLACLFAGTGILLIGISYFFKKVLENMGDKRVEKIIKQRNENKEEDKDDRDRPGTNEQ